MTVEELQRRLEEFEDRALGDTQVMFRPDFWEVQRRSITHVPGVSWDCWPVVEVKEEDANGVPIIIIE